MARGAPRPRTTLIAPGAHSPGGGVEEGGSSAGIEAGRPGVPSIGRRPGQTGSQGCSWGTETEARTTRTARARAGPHRTSVHLGGVRGWLLRGSGRPCGLRNPGPGSLRRDAHGRTAFLTWLYLLPSAPSDSRGPTFRGLQTTPSHQAPDFHLPAQRALFAGLHRYANPGAANRAAWEAGGGHGGVRRGAGGTGASGTAWRAGLLGRQGPLQCSRPGPSAFPWKVRGWTRLVSDGC